MHEKTIAERIVEALERMAQREPALVDVEYAARHITGALLRDYDVRMFSDWRNYLSTMGREVIERELRMLLADVELLHRH
jgi:hypothetical protein